MELEKNVANPFVRKMTLQKKKSMIFSAINQVKMQGNNKIDAEILQMEEQTDDWIDEKGRTIRWRRIVDLQVAMYKKRCCGNGERDYSGYEAEQMMTALSEDLYERLEARRRAISNWKRLKIVIVILKMCNGKIDTE